MAGLSFRIVGCCLCQISVQVSKSMFYDKLRLPLLLAPSPLLLCRGRSRKGVERGNILAFLLVFVQVSVIVGRCSLRILLKVL